MGENKGGFSSENLEEIKNEEGNQRTRKVK